MNNVVQVQSLQVWVCDACGSQDTKSCSCNSPAHMEKVLERRAQDRARQQRHRKKSNENNDGVTRDTTVENIEESDGGRETEIAEPAVIEDKLLYSIQRMNEHARVFKRLFKASAFDREAQERISTAIDKNIEKWRSTQAVLTRRSRDRHDRANARAGLYIFAGQAFELAEMFQRGVTEERRALTEETVEQVRQTAQLWTSIATSLTSATPK